MKVSFSPALAEDIPHIFRLNKELIHRYEDLDAIPYEKVLGWVEHNIRQQLPHFRRIIAEGQLAGYFCLCPAEGKWELDSLFVFPEYQNRGIGTEVVRYCQNQADPTLFLYVFKENTGAMELYRRLGFQIIKEVRTTAYIMEYENRG